MAKQKFDLEKSALFSTPAEDVTTQETTKKKAKMGRPLNEALVRGNSIQEGLTEEYTRATFIVKVDTLEQLKDYAYTERLKLKDLINQILEEYLEGKTDNLVHRPDDWR